jgi:hypothetical protein
MIYYLIEILLEYLLSKGCEMMASFMATKRSESWEQSEGRVYAIFR